ncbi:hypothetical protein, partial [Enterocloster clostridioformis]
GTLKTLTPSLQENAKYFTTRSYLTLTLFCQIRSNHISPFRYSKSPENLDFPGFLTIFDSVVTVD